MLKQITSIRLTHPKLFSRLFRLLRFFVSPFLRIYPFSFQSEALSAAIVIQSGDWNSTYSQYNLVTEAESDLCRYFDVSHAILVSSGGVALEMLLRLLSKPSTTVCHHNLTCAAVPFSILRSGRVPVLCNPEDNLFSNSFTNNSNPDSILLKTHFWGCLDNSSNHKAKATTIDDSCLSLGSTFLNGCRYDNNSIASIYSFGCIKPLQAGEGGLIITNDSELASSLRIMLNYGNSIRIDGNPSLLSFGLNGRISNITASIIKEQLSSYDQYLDRLRSNLYIFNTLLNKHSLPFHIYNFEHCDISHQSITCVILYSSCFNSPDLEHHLRSFGINCFSTFFGPLSNDSYFLNHMYKTDFSHSDFLALDYSISLANHQNLSSKYISLPRFWIDSIYFRRILLNALFKLSIS